MEGSDTTQHFAKSQVENKYAQSYALQSEHDEQAQLMQMQIRDLTNVNLQLQQRVADLEEQIRQKDAVIALQRDHISKAEQDSPKPFFVSPT